MKSYSLGLSLIIILSGSTTALGKQEAKPNLSGVWVLDKDKSNLKAPSMSTQGTSAGGAQVSHGSNSGSSGGHGGGMGGSHRGGMGGSGRGGSSPRQSGGSGSGNARMDIDVYQIGEIADKLTILHADPAILITQSYSTGDKEETQQWKYSADGKSYQRKMPDGGIVKSMTHWEGSQLVTKCKEQATLGALEITEMRSLSADGKTLTIKLINKGNSSNWTQTAVYSKAAEDQ